MVQYFMVLAESDFDRLKHVFILISVFGPKVYGKKKKDVNSSFEMRLFYLYGIVDNCFVVYYIYL